MKTDVIAVSGRSEMAEVLNQVDKVAAYKDLTKKGALHLRLLTEEMMGLVRSITGETNGQFWIEDEDGVYSLHLTVKTSMDSGKRSQLLAASSSGKNESARGLMGRLRDLFDQSEDDDVISFSNPLLVHGVYEHTTGAEFDWEWSMLRYEDELNSRVRQNDSAAKEAWDELEKSVVARVADDVKVSIKGRTVEMTIIKKLA